MWKFSSSMPYTMMQLRYDSKSKPQYMRRNDGTSLVICGKTNKPKTTKTTTRKQERNNQGNPSIPPHPQIHECHVQSCFVVFSSRTTSYLTTVQVLASATYPTLGPQQHLPLQSDTSDSSSLSHTRLFPDKSETMHVIANSLQTSHIRQSCKEN